MYDSNGRRRSNAGLVVEEPTANVVNHPNHHHRQIEANLLNHRHLVVLSQENAPNIARIHIEVDARAASAMAARTFVDSNTIQVHQRRASHDHLAPLSAARRSSITHPQQQQGVPQSLSLSLSMSPLYMNAAHISGFTSVTADSRTAVHTRAHAHAHAGGQLTQAGRVIANSARLMKSGVPERTVGRVECLADMHNSSFNQPRFAQQTVGSLMGIKQVQ